MRLLGSLTSFCIALSAPVSAARAFDLPCRHEDALAETAANFLLDGRAVESAALLPEARNLGFDGVAVHAHEGHDEAALITWLRGLAERADGALVCGEARNESRRLVLVSVRGGSLRLSDGRAFGKLEPGFVRPHLVVEKRDGEIKRIDVTSALLSEGVAVGTDVELRRVQLVAEGPTGPRPVAELVPDPEARRVPVPVPVTAGDAPRGPRSRPVEALFARVDGFRQSQGVGTLRSNQLLSESAQRHAERVCELGRVAHRLNRGDDPETRLREEHVAARAVGEAVARAESADAALEAVFESPSHRMAVAEKRFTDAGIGQAVDGKGHTCLVVLLASWPHRIP